MTEIQEAIDLLDRGLVLLTSAGAVQWMSSRARHWLGSYFGHGRGRASLPEPIARWLSWQTAGDPGELAKPREPLVVSREGARLVVRPVSRGSYTLLLLQEEHSSVPPSALRSLGLTRRETEVLAWVAEGKASSDIGSILGIGRRAVEKHLEHIYPKLGVETRTAAAARALALLSGPPASVQG